MADDLPGRSAPFQFDFTTSNYQPYLPLRKMQGAGFRSTSFNGMMSDGQFRKRGDIVVDTSTITVDQNGAFSELYNGQTPADIELLQIDPFSATVEAPVGVVLTSNECWIIRVSGTTNVTPRYTTGTITITNGSTNLVGSGTLWNTNGIVAGQLVIFPNATVNAISSVNSDTSITLKTAYAGGDLAGSAYTIRRTSRFWGNNYTTPPNHFARIFNGDLYYTFVEGTANFCVVRVQDVLGSIGTPTIIGARLYANGSGCDIWTDAVTEIKGLELLADGRVVIATSETTSSTRVQARIRYSSHLDQKVWNTAPGGFSDVVNLPGKMNAMRDYGGYLTCHFDTGIVLAAMTGQDDPPLAFQRVQTTRIGCVNSRGLANSPFGQIFLGSDGNVYSFDGSGQQLVSEATRTTIGGPNSNAFHAAYEDNRNTWWLFDTSSSTGTNMYALDMGNGGLASYHKTSTFITAAQNFGANRTDARLVLGLPSYDPAASGTAGATSTMLYDLVLNGSRDIVPAFTGVSTVAALSLKTDVMDFGLPGIDKTLDHIILFYESAGSYSLRITYTRDGGATDSATVSVTNTSGEEKFAKFYFTPKTSEKWQFVIDTTTVNTTAWDVRPQRMVIYYRAVEGVEPVAR